MTAGSEIATVEQLDFKAAMGVLSDNGGSFTANAWIPPATVLEFDVWALQINFIQLMLQNNDWWAGDILLYGEEHFGDQWSQYALEDPRYDESMATLMFVARKFPPGKRSSVSWNHHYMLIQRDVPEEEWEYWLERAEEGKMSARAMIEAWKEEIEVTGQQSDLPVGERASETEPGEAEFSYGQETIRSKVVNLYVAYATLYSDADTRRKLKRHRQQVPELWEQIDELLEVVADDATIVLDSQASGLSQMMDELLGREVAEDADDHADDDEVPGEPEDDPEPGEDDLDDVPF